MLKLIYIKQNQWLCFIYALGIQDTEVRTADLSAFWYGCSTHQENHLPV
ncbi:hypothetical protein [Nostoc sp. CENA543]|nr:hypothetical protein [Nostoc sp. CENA543]